MDKNSHLLIEHNRAVLQVGTISVPCSFPLQGHPISLKKIYKSQLFFHLTLLIKKLFCTGPHRLEEKTEQGLI